MIQHHGIILRDPPVGDAPNADREWPQGFSSYGDSFLVWGEHRLVDAARDHTLHVIYKGPLNIVAARRVLELALTEDERLIDYATTSDDLDWSEDEVIYTLEDFV